MSLIKYVNGPTWEGNTIVYIGIGFTDGQLCQVRTSLVAKMVQTKQCDDFIDLPARVFQTPAMIALQHH